VVAWPKWRMRALVARSHESLHRFDRMGSNQELTSVWNLPVRGTNIFLPCPLNPERAADRPLPEGQKCRDLR
jgi:hypothetical protein